MLKPSNWTNFLQEKFFVEIAGEKYWLSHNLMAALLETSLVIRVLFHHKGRYIEGVIRPGVRVEFSQAVTISFKGFIGKSAFHWRENVGVVNMQGGQFADMNDLFVEMTELEPVQIVAIESHAYEFVPVSGQGEYRSHLVSDLVLRNMLNYGVPVIKLAAGPHAGHYIAHCEEGSYDDGDHHEWYSVFDGPSFEQGTQIELDRYFNGEFTGVHAREGGWEISTLNIAIPGEQGFVFACTGRKATLGEYKLVDVLTAEPA